MYFQLMYNNILLKFKRIHLDTQVCVYNLFGFKNSTKTIHKQHLQEFLSQSES